MGDDVMTFINVALSVIFAAILALIPIGCIMTRHKKTEPPKAG
jgi:hypothetical protein